MIKKIFILIVLLIAAGILYSYYVTEQKNSQVKAQIEKAEVELNKPPPPVIVREVIREQQQIERLIRPPAKSSRDGESDAEPPKAASAPPPPPVAEKKIVQVDDTALKEYERNRQINIELIGILKLQINESNSWETIAKLLILILVSYGGIKYINKRFA